MATVPNLDKRIAAALVENEHDAADLEALIKEITDTIASITAEVAHASKELLQLLNGPVATLRKQADNRMQNVASPWEAVGRISSVISARTRSLASGGSSLTNTPMVEIMLSIRASDDASGFCSAGAGRETAFDMP
jgi:hypothetical protein